MSTPNLPDILARLAAATPGPWHRMTVPDGPAGGDRLTNLIGATDPDGGETCVGAANEAADLTFIANAPADLAALAARVAALEAECATQRATLADSRVARVLALIRAIEDDAVAAINGAPNRGALTARLLVLADEQPHPTEVETDHDLDRIGLLTLGPYRRLADTVTANPSAARVLARLTAATEATP